MNSKHASEADITYIYKINKLWIIARQLFCTEECFKEQLQIYIWKSIYEVKGKYLEVSEEHN